MSEIVPTIDRYNVSLTLLLARLGDYPLSIRVRGDPRYLTAAIGDACAIAAESER